MGEKFINNLSGILSRASALAKNLDGDPESVKGKLQEAIVNAELLCSIPGLSEAEVLGRISIARACLERLPSGSINDQLRILIENVPRTAT